MDVVLALLSPVKRAIIVLAGPSSNLFVFLEVVFGYYHLLHPPSSPRHIRLPFSASQVRTVRQVTVYFSRLPYLAPPKPATSFKERSLCCCLIMQVQ